MKNRIGCLVAVILSFVTVGVGMEDRSTSDKVSDKDEFVPSK